MPDDVSKRYRNIDHFNEPEKEGTEPGSSLLI
jgi:hypothetical protein